MSISAFLKAQLTDFVDVYKKYFEQTFGIACLFTAVCFAVSGLFLAYSNFEGAGVSRDMGLLNYFFQRYSKPGAYVLSDLTKTVFIYLVSLFSVLLIKQPGSDTHPRVLSAKYFRYMTGREFSILTACLGVCCLADYVLYRMGVILIAGAESNSMIAYLYSFFFHLRVYIPLLLFALAIRWLTTEGKMTITLQQLLFLYIGLWLANECAYETLLWARLYIIHLVLMPLNDSFLYYAFEALIGVPLMACYFLGYYSAMVISLRIIGNMS